MKYYISLLIAIAFSASAHADLWLPSIFSNEMVLQQNETVPVWGQAIPGATVSVQFAGQIKKDIADENGKWKLSLNPMPTCSLPREMNISSAFDSKISHRKLSDVLVGEVWILAGQSNMAWPLSKCTGGLEAAADANYPWLRIFKQWPWQGATDKPANDVTGGMWSICTADNASNISGIGFFFARQLHKALPPDTPIALISTSMGGTYTECWIDLETLKRTPSARHFMQKAAREIKPGQCDPKGNWGEENFRRPAAMYNGKIAPLQPFSVRGVIWYQGEGNSQKWLADSHAQTLTSLINSWRKGWQMPDLPFLVVQLPRYDAGPGSDWPTVRAAQANVARNLPAVELAVTIDCGSKTQIHPPDKEPIGTRLVLLAQAKIYGQMTEYAGPVFKSAQIINDAIFVRMDFANGLHFKDGIAKGFEICGTDQIFVPAQVEIVTENQLKIFSAKIKRPTAIRYAWFNWGPVSLQNANGLPSAPFKFALSCGSIP